jgi:hypothetical protein
MTGKDEMGLKDELPNGLTVRLPEQFERRAAIERWEAADWTNAGRWLTRLRDEFDVHELTPVVEASEVVALQAWSPTLGFESVSFRVGPPWPMLQALADLWFVFAEGKVKLAALPTSAA